MILGVTGTLELVIPLGARLGHPLWRKALEGRRRRRTTSPTTSSSGSPTRYVAWQENSFPGLLGNVVAGRIANRLDLGGTNCVVDAACASSLSAPSTWPALELAAGRADVVLTGGVDTFNDIFMYMCFSKTPALSPTGDAKPFDAAGDGTILGEGLGIVVLKRLADAERDGDRIYAVLNGIGSSSDGKGNAIYAPSPAGQVEAPAERLPSWPASRPDTIELVEAHGTGTKVGDAAEVDGADRGVPRGEAGAGRGAPLGSVKSQIGHTKAAAGAAGLIKAALALHHKVLPPTLKVTQPLEPLQPARLAVLRQHRDAAVAAARRTTRGGPAVSAFGFGGSNFHCVLEEHRPKKPALDWDGDGRDRRRLGATRRPTLAADARSLAADAPGTPSRAAAAESRAAFRSDAAVPARRSSPTATRPTCRSCSPARAVEARRAEPDGTSLAHAGRGRTSAPARPPGKLARAVPRPGVAVRRHAPRPGLPVPGDARRPRRRPTARSPRTDDGRAADRPHLPAAGLRRRRAGRPGDAPARDRRRPAGPRGGRASGRWQRAASGSASRPTRSPATATANSPPCAPPGGFDAGRPASLCRGSAAGSWPQQRGGDAGRDARRPRAARRRRGGRSRDERLDLVDRQQERPDAGGAVRPDGARSSGPRRRSPTRRSRHVRLPVAAAFHSPLVADAARAVPRGARRASRSPPATARSSPTRRPAEYPADPHAARDLLAEPARPAGRVRRPGPGHGRGRRADVPRSRPRVGRSPGWSTRSSKAGPTGDAECFALDASGGKRSGMARPGARPGPARRARPRRSIWPRGRTGSRCRPRGRAKPGLTVPICGANYVTPAAGREAASRGHRSAPAAPKPVDSTPRARSCPSPPRAPAAAPRTVMSATPLADRPEFRRSRVTQQSLLAFQRMQEQTAQLHRQFLDTQEAAQRTLHAARRAAAGAADGGNRWPALASAAAAGAGRTVRAAARDHAASGVPSAPPAGPATPPAACRRPRRRRRSRPTAATSSAILLAVVAEKTGYPAEMLGLDMALDADLGIDSIKRVEILSALQEKLPDAPAVKPEHLGTLHTLRDIVDFLAQRPAAASRLRRRRERSPRRRTRPTGGCRQASCSRVVAEKTGYPAEMLDLDMALDADLGIDSIKRVEILSALQEQLPDAPGGQARAPRHPPHPPRHRRLPGGIARGPPPPAPMRPRPRRPHALSPQRRLSTPLRVGATPPSPPNRPKPRRRPTRRPRSSGASSGRSRSARTASAAGSRSNGPPPVWVIADPSSFAAKVAQALDAAGLRPPGHRLGRPAVRLRPDRDSAGLVLIAPEAAGPDDLPLRAFRWLTAPAPPCRVGQGAAVFATVTRLDGAFGFGTLEPLADPIARRPSPGWPRRPATSGRRSSCKAIDVDPHVDAGTPPHAVVDEILTAGPVEVGHRRQAAAARSD